MSSHLSVSTQGTSTDQQFSRLVPPVNGHVNVVNVQTMFEAARNTNYEPNAEPAREAGGPIRHDRNNRHVNATPYNQQQGHNRQQSTLSRITNYLREIAQWLNITWLSGLSGHDRQEAPERTSSGVQTERKHADSETQTEPYELPEKEELELLRKLSKKYSNNPSFIKDESEESSSNGLFEVQTFGKAKQESQGLQANKNYSTFVVGGSARVIANPPEKKPDLPPKETKERRRFKSLKYPPNFDPEIRPENYRKIFEYLGNLTTPATEARRAGRRFSSRRRTQVDVPPPSPPKRPLVLAQNPEVTTPPRKSMYDIWPVVVNEPKKPEPKKLQPQNIYNQEGDMNNVQASPSLKKKDKDNLETSNFSAPPSGRVIPRKRSNLFSANEEDLLYPEEIEQQKKEEGSMPPVDIATPESAVSNVQPLAKRAKQSSLDTKSQSPSSSTTITNGITETNNATKHVTFSLPPVSSTPETINTSSSSFSPPNPQSQGSPFKPSPGILTNTTIDSAGQLGASLSKPSSSQVQSQDQDSTPLNVNGNTDTKEKPSNNDLPSIVQTSTVLDPLKLHLSSSSSSLTIPDTPTAKVPTPDKPSTSAVSVNPLQTKPQTPGIEAEEMAISPPFSSLTSSGFSQNSGPSESSQQASTASPVPIFRPVNDDSVPSSLKTPINEAQQPSTTEFNGQTTDSPMELMDTNESPFKPKDPSPPQSLPNPNNIFHFGGGNQAPAAFNVPSAWKMPGTISEMPNLTANNGPSTKIFDVNMFSFDGPSNTQQETTTINANNKRVDPGKYGNTGSKRRTKIPRQDQKTLPSFQFPSQGTPTAQQPPMFPVQQTSFNFGLFQTPSTNLGDQSLQSQTSLQPQTGFGIPEGNQPPVNPQPVNLFNNINQPPLLRSDSFTFPDGKTRQIKLPRRRR